MEGLKKGDNKMKKQSYWWIRRGRDDGKETLIAITELRWKLDGYYTDIDLALDHASHDNPLTTGYADYYPETKKEA